MLRLKLIIQERSDYLPAIQYISWIIRIKLQFKRQLLTKRSSIRKEQISLRAEATSVKNDIRTETGKLELLAETVRYYWAKPIAYLNADICYNSISVTVKSGNGLPRSGDSSSAEAETAKNRVRASRMSRTFFIIQDTPFNQNSSARTAQIFRIKHTSGGTACPL